MRTAQKHGATPLRSQQRFIELTRDKVKVADQAARAPSRFHMAPLAQRSPLEGKVPRTQRRRIRNSGLQTLPPASSPSHSPWWKFWGT